jgi:hypothetical protein
MATQVYEDEQSFFDTENASDIPKDRLFEVGQFRIRGIGPQRMINEIKKHGVVMLISSLQEMKVEER